MKISNCLQLTVRQTQHMVGTGSNVQAVRNQQQGAVVLVRQTQQQSKYLRPTVFIINCR